MVQSATPHAVKENRLQSEEDLWLGLMRLTREGLAAHPETDLVVWPETMHPWYLVENSDFRSRYFLNAVGTFAGRFGRPLIAGANTYADVDRALRGYNSGVLVDAAGAVQGIYRKQRLVPMGEEFLPRRVFPEAWCDTWFDWLARNIGYPRSCDLEAGEGFVTLDAGPGLRCATLICFEGLYASDCRAAAATGEPDLLMHLVNNGWFGESFEQRQCVASWVLRAVETRTPFLSCANAGITCAVAPSGEVLGRVDKVFGTGFMAVAVPPRWPETPFSKGGWALPAAAVALAVAAAYLRARRRDP